MSAVHRIVHLGAGFLLALALFGTAAWFSAPWWLGILLQSEMERLGFRQVAVKIESVRLSESRISSLHLQHDSFEINSEHAIISYTFAELLRQHLDILSIKTLNISMHSTPQQPTKNALILVSPAALLSQIPASNIQIDQISLRHLDDNGNTLQLLSGWLAYRDQALHLNMYESADHDTLQAAVSMDTQGLCSIQLKREQVDIIQAQCQISEQDDRMHMQGDLYAELTELDTLLGEWIEMPEHKLNGKLQLKWAASLPAKIQQEQLLQSIRLNMEVAVDAVLEQQKQSYSAKLKASMDHTNGKADWRIDDDSQLRFNEHLRSTLAFSNVTGSVDQLAPLHLSLKQGSALQVLQFSDGNITIPKLSLRLLSPLQSSHSGNGIHLDKPVDIAVGTNGLRWQDISLNTRDMRIALKAGSLLAPAGSIVVDGLEVQSGTQTDAIKTPIPLNLTADFNFSHRPFSLRGTLSGPGDLPHLDWRINLKPEKVSGNLDFTLNSIQPADVPWLMHILGDKNTVGIHQGSLSGSGQLRWSNKQAPTANIDLALQGISGFYQTTTFSGLDSGLNITANGENLQLITDKLHMQTLDAGLPTTDLSMAAVINYPFDGAASARITELQTHALGGLISSQRIDIDSSRTSNPFTVSLKEIDAGQLAEFRKQEGLSAEGKLDGTLPFDWTDKGLKMTSGKLASRDPGGVIRYLGTASMQQFAATDTATSMAMQILSDFRFRVLNMQADYQPDGELALQISIKGHNPAYENGRPVNLNFNIEENVIKLLQSLRMADEISGRVEKKIKGKK